MTSYFSCVLFYCLISLTLYIHSPIVCPKSNTAHFTYQVADLKNKLETEKGKDEYPKANVRLIYAGKYMHQWHMPFKLENYM